MKILFSLLLFFYYEKGTVYLVTVNDVTTRNRILTENWQTGFISMCAYLQMISIV